MHLIFLLGTNKVNTNPAGLWILLVLTLAFYISTPNYLSAHKKTNNKSKVTAQLTTQPSSSVLNRTL